MQITIPVHVTLEQPFTIERFEHNYDWSHYITGMLPLGLDLDTYEFERYIIELIEHEGHRKGVHFEADSEQSQFFMNFCSYGHAYQALPIIHKFIAELWVAEKIKDARIEARS